jgi:hypothetical protein
MAFICNETTYSYLRKSRTFFDMKRPEDYCQISEFYKQLPIGDYSRNSLLKSYYGRCTLVH